MRFCNGQKLTDMKKRLVLWGENPEKERVLVAIGYDGSESAVKTYIFPESVATEEFVNQMMNLWREGNEVPFPDLKDEMEVKITEADNLIPEGYSTERDDLIDKAKAEWVYLFMSEKLASVYKGELEEIGDKIENARRFEQTHWDELKNFWEKVQEQIREKNLFHTHYKSLRESVNSHFDRLKELRKELDEILRKDSESKRDEFYAELSEIEKKIEEGMGLKPLFEDLKDIQRRFKNSKLVRDHRNKVFKRIDGLFKVVKKKRFGEKATKPGASRTQRRYDGLINAIKKMEKSVDRDKKELDFQDKRIESTAGQLESQIRKAKIKMIEERMRSKQVKLDEMLGIKEQLEDRLKVEKEKEEQKKRQAEVEKRKEEAKKKIEEEMKAKKEQLKEEEDKIKKAAESLGADAKQSKPSTKQDTKIEDAKEKKAGDKTSAEKSSGKPKSESAEMDKIIASAAALAETIKQGDTSEEE